MMKKIVLLCNMGMSTSMLVEKMKEVAYKKGYECSIEAHSLSKAKEVAAEADCILVGPQVKFQISKIKEDCPNVPIKDIDMLSYGTMNGEAVLKLAKELIAQ
ncbi:PTS sugar transporter subunit IIB [Salipaludibacillus sp. LMS25]|jgi:PTS system cellobiose-specific IIB component|uniref:PTS sugar transporter subunit IIB n=1 Tax=Salipaludibacillus sp. LMS25 TaxID=2924031 RepID=UPI0020D057F1|nr:PTS sugar transporter subunit IIB [Salipaludibacillus sp. LMS25]UTR15938.1 PTS sugar transporter subunit IIB [Salipaludibacillus sp. LMS25]